jgi:Rab-GTPase-TBC domain
LDEYLPKVAAKFRELELPPIVVSFEWFMTLFIGHLPMEASLRVIDLFFAAGPRSMIVFSCALALLKLREPELLQQVEASEYVSASL